MVVMSLYYIRCCLVVCCFCSLTCCFSCKDKWKTMKDLTKTFLKQSTFSFVSNIFRLPPERHSDGPRHPLVTGARLQRQRELWSLQDHGGNVHLWKQGHLLLRPCSGAVALQSTETRTGQAAPAHLGNPLPDEQRPAAEVRPVSDISPPHWGSAYCAETGRRDSVTELWDQSGPRWGNLCVSVFVR